MKLDKKLPNLFSLNCKRLKFDPVFAFIHFKVISPFAHFNLQVLRGHAVWIHECCKNAWMLRWCIWASCLISLYRPSLSHNRTITGGRPLTAFKLGRHVFLRPGAKTQNREYEQSKVGSSVHWTYATKRNFLHLWIEHPSTSLQL